MHVLAAGVPLGTLPNWLTFVVLITVAWVLRKGAAGSAISILQNANRVLESRIAELEAQVKDYAKRIAELSAATDIALALQPVMAWTVAHEKVDEERFADIAATIGGHEANAAERSKKELHLLGLIAGRLGPDGEQ